MVNLQNDPFEIVAEALEKDNIEILNPLRNLVVSDQVDVNAWCDEVTLLGEVAEAGDLELVRLMVEKGADVNLITKSDASTALMQAAHGGHLEIVQFLVEVGADIDEVRGGARAIDYASNAGHEEVVEYLTSLTTSVKQQVIQVAQQSKNKQSFSTTLDNDLFDSVDAWDVEEVIRLLDNGANPNAVNELGDKVIAYAANRARFNIVEVLLRAGACPNETGEKSTALMVAASFGDFNTVEALINAGATINTVFDNRTPLMQAIEWAFPPDDLKIVRLLIQAGINLEEQDKYGNTALMLAIEKDKSDIAEVLISTGASDEKVKNIKLIKACLSGDIKQIQDLLRADANPNARDSSGLPALNAAAMTGKTEVVGLLVDADADIEVRDEKGCTSLMAAIDRVHIEVVQQLLEAGACVHAIDNYDRNVTDHAYEVVTQKSTRHDILKILNKYGAPGRSQKR